MRVQLVAPVGADSKPRHTWAEISGKRIRIDESEPEICFPYPADLTRTVMNRFKIDALSAERLIGEYGQRFRLEVVDEFRREEGINSQGRQQDESLANYELIQEIDRRLFAHFLLSKPPTKG